MNKKIRSIGVIAIVTIWALLSGFHWFGPKTELSEAEWDKYYVQAKNSL